MASGVTRMSQATTPLQDAIPAYWEQAKSELCKRDRILRKLIPQFGELSLTGRGEPFITLTRSIIGQQISTKSAEAAWQRLLGTVPVCSPAGILSAGTEILATCGLSRRKVEYILDLALHFDQERIRTAEWEGMEDEAIIADLTQVRGVGRWTAEMFLIFNLMRPDVLPLDDAGLLKGISVNYFSGEPVSRSDAREVAANWEPWRTVATWYLWRSLEPIPVKY